VPHNQDPNTSIPVVFNTSQIEERVRALGEQITSDYHGKKLKVIGILRGSSLFLADIVRAISLPVQVDFIEVSSYGHETVSSGVVKIVKDLTDSISGQDVLIVEDIIDTGLTLNFLVDLFKSRNASSVHIASLLIKGEKQKMKYPIKYFGFNIPDLFVVGYGMDFKGYLRNLPYIGYVADPQKLSHPLFYKD